jgi:hypothetical protein
MLKALSFALLTGILLLAGTLGGSCAGESRLYFESRPTGRIPLQEIFGNKASPFADVTSVHLLLQRPQDEKIFVRLANRRSAVGGATLFDGKGGLVYRFVITRVAGHAMADAAYPDFASVRLDVVGWEASPIPTRP